MDQGDICFCGHIREEHFGHDCSRVDCHCKQFVLIDVAPAVLAALKKAVHRLDRIEGFGCPQDILDDMHAIIDKAENS